MKTQKTLTENGIEYLVCDIVKPKPASTTVWTNHGEPQPLDDKHFGVALQAEAETDTTRQASPIPEIDESVQKYVNKMRAKYAKVWEERSDLRAQRDELLAAVTDMMHDLDIFYTKYRSPDNYYIEKLKIAIANASK